MRALTIAAILTATACSTAKPYAALAWDALDSAYTQQVEAAPAKVESLVKAGQIAEADKAVDQLKASVAKWNLLSISIEMALRNWTSGEAPADLLGYLQQARALVKELGVAIP